MTRRITRAALIAAGALIAWFALRRTAPFAPRPAELFDNASRAASSWSRPDTLDSGETFDLLMRRGGIDGVAARAILGAAPMLDPRRLPAGMAVQFIADSQGAPPREIVLKLAIDSLLRITRAPGGSWTAVQDVLPWTVDTVVMRGAVPERGSLHTALSATADLLFPGPAHEPLVIAIASVYDYRVDMTTQLRAGDSVYALVERARGPEFTTRVRRVLATRLFVDAKPMDAFYFPSESAGRQPKSKYYDALGKSLATAFLRTPIEFARISSGFGMRFHPILKVRRPHEGTDYAAASGTPVRSIGDGTVVSAVYNPGGYGNMVEVRHINGIVSRYAHLSRFAPSARRGTRVLQGETVGYVGMTGLATAPHLHFEMLVGGQQRNPAQALKNVDGTPIPAADRPRFEMLRTMLTGLLGRPEGVVRIAKAK